eukprot:463837-Pelagomonas_calceolata.AAC.1
MKAYQPTVCGCKFILRVSHCVHRRGNDTTPHSCSILRANSTNLQHTLVTADSCHDQEYGDKGKIQPHCQYTQKVCFGNLASRFAAYSFSLRVLEYTSTRLISPTAWLPVLSLNP